MVFLFFKCCLQLAIPPGLHGVSSLRWEVWEALESSGRLVLPARPPDLPGPLAFSQGLSEDTVQL